MIVLREGWLRWDGKYRVVTGYTSTCTCHVLAMTCACQLLFTVEALACDSFYKSMGGHVW